MLQVVHTKGSKTTSCFSPRIGYFNSTLNPVIYVMTNRDFKDAFTDILRRIFCWCADKDSFGGGSRGDWTNHSNVDFV